MNYSSEEKTRMRLGFQCPECFGVQMENMCPAGSHERQRFQCQECGAQWLASAPQFQGQV